MSRVTTRSRSPAAGSSRLDTRYAHLFYLPALTASAYAAWLRANRVA